MSVGTDPGGPEGVAPTELVPLPKGAHRPCRRWAVTPVHLLLLAIVGFTVLLTVVSWLRLIELTPSTWDLGIYQQALWSGAHGGPFYESADYETGGYGSFLQVHSAFLLYAVAPLYRALPSPVTLFALQAGVVASAAVPLYLLVRDLGGSSRRGLVAGALFLLSSSTLSSTLYDFHIESFLPLETFALVLLWNRRRYVAGALVALLGFFTMEAAPIFVAGVALFFLLGESPVVWSTLRHRPELPRWRRVREVLRTPVVASAALLLAAIAAYYVLLIVRWDLLASLAGFPPFPTAESGYVIGGTPQALGLSLGALQVGFFSKSLYWIGIFALVLYLPLIVPRSVVIVLPWMLFTFLSSNLNYVTMGFQYGFLVAAGLFPGVAYGLARFPLAALPRARGEPRPTVPRRRALRRWIPLLLIGVLALNVALSPLDPLLQGSGPGSAFQVNYRVPPGYAGAVAVADLIPRGAPVLASDVLFPLVADDLHAYTLFWGPNPYLILPFNATALPEFVLLAESRLYAVPGWLAYVLYDPSVYGLRALAWTTPVGAVVLFERGFGGVAAVWGGPPTSNLTIAPSAAGVGTLSWLVPEPASPFGQAVESVPYAAGQLWATPPFDLPSGEYRFQFWLKSWAETSSAPPSPSTAVLTLEGNPFAQGGWFDLAFTFGQVSHAGFEPISVTQNITQPAFQVVLRGYASTPMAGIGLAEIIVTRVGPVS